MNHVSSMTADDNDDPLTVAEVIAAYDALLNEIANNDRAVIRRLLQSPNLSQGEREALAQWAERVEVLSSEFMLRNFSAGGSA